MVHLEPVMIKSEAIQVRRAGAELWRGNIGVMQFATKIRESMHKLNTLSR